MKLMKTEEAVGQILCHDVTRIIPGECPVVNRFVGVKRIYDHFQRILELFVILVLAPADIREAFPTG